MARISGEKVVVEILLFVELVDGDMDIVVNVSGASVGVPVLEEVADVVFSSFKAGGKVTAMIVQSTTKVTLPATTQARLLEIFTS